MSHSVTLPNGTKIDVFRVGRYLCTTINGKTERVSRIVWKMTCDHPVPKRIYHRDGDAMNCHPSNLTADRSLCVNDTIRKACQMIASTRCVRVDDNVVCKASGKTVFSGYGRLAAMGVISGVDPIIAHLAAPEYRFVTLSVHPDLVDDVMRKVHRMHTLRGYPYDHH